VTVLASVTASASRQRPEIAAAFSEVTLDVPSIAPPFRPMTGVAGYVVGNSGI
jgi:hypothetical protein